MSKCKNCGYEINDNELVRFIQIYSKSKGKIFTPDVQKGRKYLIYLAGINWISRKSFDIFCKTEKICGCTSPEPSEVKQ